MKFKKSIVVGLCILLLGLPVYGESFTRDNWFSSQTGSVRIVGIKKFKATFNAPVNGKEDKVLNTLLHDPNLVVYDAIENPPSNGTWIAINKTNRTLTMYKGKNVVYKFPVAVGTSETPTPSIKGKVQNKHVNPAWGGMGGKYKPVSANDPKNPLGERWMGLSLPGHSGYGIHGTIKPHEIGGYVSNGCIRMYNDDIEQYIFPATPVGAPVWIGTSEELMAWGLNQGYRIDDPSTQVQVVPVEPQAEVFEAVENLEF